MRKSKLTAWLLIFFGVVLFLNHFDLFTFSRLIIAEGLSLLLAVVFINRSIHNPERKGLFGAVFFILFLVILLAMQIRIIPVNDPLGSGLVLLSLSLSNFVCFLFGRKKTSNLIWTFLFFAGGIPFIINYFDLMPIWIVEDYYSTYWPALLILVGIIILADSLLKRKKTKPDTEHTYHG